MITTFKSQSATKYQFDFIDFQVLPQNIIYYYPVLSVPLYLLMFVYMFVLCMIIFQQNKVSALS